MTTHEMAEKRILQHHNISHMTPAIKCTIQIIPVGDMTPIIRYKFHYADGCIKQDYEEPMHSYNIRDLILAYMDNGTL